MNLIELNSHTKNNKDKEILDRMLKDDDYKINKYVASVICDLLECVSSGNNYKSIAKENINKFDKDNIGEVGVYVSLFPYVQLSLNDSNDYGARATQFLEMLISYLIGYIKSDEFKKELFDMKDILSISEEFYDSIKMYFSLNKDKLLKEINQRI